MKSGKVKITKEWLLARCERDGRHLFWKLTCGNSGPRGHVHTPNSEKAQSQFAVRPAAYELWNGVPVPPGHVARPTCGHALCLAKGCLETRVHGGYNAGRQRSAATKQKMAETQRRKVGIAPDLVARVKETGNLPIKEVMAETGLSKGTIVDIRVGRRWRDYTGSMGFTAAALMKGEV